MTRIQHPFHTVKIITNDGKFGGTNLIMTEGVIRERDKNPDKERIGRERTLTRR